jgi:cytochrome b561
MRLGDTPQGYGPVTRALHWTMAAAFGWQFVSAILRVVADETPAQRFFWSTHMSVGAILLALAAVRIVWWFANRRHRPQKDSGALGTAAATGQAAMYALMVGVPLLAIVRNYGRGRALDVFGVEVIPATGVEIAALTAPGNALHGLLGWLLLALIAGHVAMALWHHRRGEGVLKRMVGRRAVS